MVTRTLPSGVIKRAAADGPYAVLLLGEVRIPQGNTIFSRRFPKRLLGKSERRETSDATDFNRESEKQTMTLFTASRRCFMYARSS
jgi:hypothetical protein